MSKLALGIGIALVLAAGAYWFTRNTTTVQVVEPPAAANPGAPAATAVVDTAPAVVDRAALTTSVAETPKAPEAKLFARCIDEQHRPLPDAWMKRAKVGKLVAHANKNGELHVEPADLGRDGQSQFLLGCSGFVTRKLSVLVTSGTTPPLGDLILERGGSVSGIVVDEQNVPMSGADVSVTQPKEENPGVNVEMLRVIGPARSATSVKSGSDGRFRIEDVAAGTVRVWARAKEFRWSVSAPIEIEAGQETRDVQLTLEREGSEAAGLGPIDGVVLAPDGTPVKLPKISMGIKIGAWGTHRDFTGLEDGHFKIIPPGHGQMELQFSDAEGRWTPAKLLDVAPATHDLVVRLGDAKQVTMIVRSQDRAVTRFTMVLHDDASWIRASNDESAKDEHPDGRVVTRAPAGSFLVKTDAKGFLPSEIGPFDGSTVGPEIVVELVPAAGVNGHVLALGKPVAGARVWLQRFARHSKVFVNEFELWVLDDEEDVTTSDEQGAFTLHVKRDDEYFLFAESTGWAKGELGPLALVATKSQDGFDITLDVGGAIEGHVLVPPGQSPEGAVVGVNHGDGKLYTHTVGADGHFRFEQLTPGGWKVMRCQAEAGGARTGNSMSGGGIDGGKIDTNCVVASGQTTTRDLDLRVSTACTLDLELKWNGVPARAWNTDLWHATPGPELGLPGGATDAQGRRRLQVDEPGQYKLVLVAPGEVGSATPINQIIELRAGTTTLVRDLKTGRVEGTIAAWHPDPESIWRYESSDGADYKITLYIAVDVNGHFTLPLVPAGPGTIVHSTGLQLATAAKFTLEAGKMLTLALP